MGHSALPRYEFKVVRSPRLFDWEFNCYQSISVHVQCVGQRCCSADRLHGQEDEELFVCSVYRLLLITTQQITPCSIRRRPFYRLSPRLLAVTAAGLLTVFDITGRATGCAETIVDLSTAVEPD